MGNSEQLTQRSQQWGEIRDGRFTGSEIWKLTVEPRTKKDKEAGVLSEIAKGYILEKLQERITQEPRPEFSSASTQWGIDNEPIAIKRYEEVTGNKVREVGFVTMGENAGCSPDGLVSFDGMIEVKCPHVNYLQEVMINPADKREYYCQIQFELLVTGRKWCDYIVFDPRFPKGQDIVIRRILRDEEKISELRECLIRAEQELNSMHKDFKKLIKLTQQLIAA